MLYNNNNNIRYKEIYNRIHNKKLLYDNNTIKQKSRIKIIEYIIDYNTNNKIYYKLYNRVHNGVYNTINNKINQAIISIFLNSL